MTTADVIVFLPGLLAVGIVIQAIRRAQGFLDYIDAAEVAAEDPLRAQIDRQYDADFLTLGPVEADARKEGRLQYLDWVQSLGDTQETLA